MKTLRRGFRRVVGAICGSRREADLAEEFAAHLELQIEDNLRAGMPPEEARRAAHLKFGNVEQAKESYRGQRGLPKLEAVFTDFRYALRGLRKAPGFTGVAVVTLALGTGAITAVFSLVDQVLLAPPGIRNPERVVAVQTNFGKLHLQSHFSSPAILPDMRASRQVFEYAALMKQADANYTGTGDPRRLHAAAVTSEYFDVFGAKPYLGRVFRPEEDQPGANRVVILSYAAWIRLFGGDPNVVGRVIELNRVPRRIVGVMPSDFRWPQDVDVWAPAGLTPEEFDASKRFGNESYNLIARTRAGVSFRRAQQWLRILTDRISHSSEFASSVTRDYQWSLSGIPFTDTIAGETKTPLLILFGAVGFVLLIVCLNIAGLLLARASARAREFAVRSALGASRTQLLRSVLSESLLLATAGGAAGIALAYGGTELLLMLAPQALAAGLHPRTDLRVLLFAASAAIASAVLSGLAPAWQISRIGPNSALKGEGYASTGGQARQRMRSALVIAETALALMLLAGGGLFLRSFLRLAEVNPGFEPRGVMTATFWLPEEAYTTAPKVTAFFRAVLDRLHNTRGVAAAALGSTIPFGSYGDSGIFQIEDRAARPGDPMPFGDMREVTPEYFTALGIPLKRGRFFRDDDRAGSEPVAIVDESLARQYWPGEDPVGRRIRNPGSAQWVRIVGVVGHTARSNLAERGTGAYFFPMFQRPVPLAGIVVKTSGPAAGVSGAIREAVREADPRQPVSRFRSMNDLVAGSLSPRRFGLEILAFFAAAALFLAALGLYGVIGYSVTQRRREIGIRIALGAAPGSVMALIVGQGLRLAAIGAAIGIAASLAAARLIQNQLFEISALDPLTIFATAAALLAAAALASFLPARRAMRIDPAITLRSE